MCATRDTELDTVVQVAGTRWCIERGFEDARQVGLDEYEVCSATGWYRHMTLAFWALALLAMLRATTFPTVPRAGVGMNLAAVRLLRQLWLRMLPTADHVLAWKRSHAWIA